MNIADARARRRGRGRWASVLLVSLLIGLQTLLTSPVAAAAGACDDPPPLDAYNGGMTGAIDPAIGHGQAGSAYIEYGYGGMVWHTYDTGSVVTGCSDPRATLDTWTGNTLFNGAKVLVATTNGLHWMVYEGGVADKMDDAVKLGSSAAYSGFAVPFLPIALLIVAIILFKSVFAGRLAETFGGAARIGIGLTFIAATALSPLLYSQIFDNLINDGVKQIDTQMNQNLYGDTVYRDIQPTTLHDQIVWKNWLRGEFGGDDSDGPSGSKLAKEQGRKLLDAQAFTHGEMINGDDGKTAVIDKKKAEFKEVAGAIKPTSSYSTFQGTTGSRTGTGVLAFAEAGIMTPLPIVSKAALLFAQLVLRAAVLFGPLIGMFMLLNGVARTVFRGIFGVLVLGLLFWAIANLDTLILKKVLESDQSIIAKLVLMALINGLIWTVLRPIKRLRAMMVSSMYTVPGQGMHRAAEWLRHARLRRALRRSSKSDDERWHPWRDRRKRPRAETEGAADEAMDAPATVYADAVRPEAAAPIAAGIAGGAGDGRSGSAGAAGAAGGRPGGPRGGAPAGGAGGGVYFADPRSTHWQPHEPVAGTVRAEATRLYPWTPQDGTTQAGLSGGTVSSSAPELTGTSQHALPPGRHALPPGTGRQDSQSSDQSMGGERNEIVTPADVEAKDQGRPLREAPSHTAEDGKRVWGLYTPGQGYIEVSEDQINQSTRSSTRPEMPDNRPADGPENSTTDEGGN